jgi:hypothetical protein
MKPTGVGFCNGRFPKDILPEIRIGFGVFNNELLRRVNPYRKWSRSDLLAFACHV